MKIVFISDTHNKHRQIMVPDGDVVVHAGDVSGSGHKNEIVSFMLWFKALPHKYKIFIAGNHDWAFQHYPVEMRNLIPKEVIYLQDSEVIIEGIKFYGSPVQPSFYDWAFNIDRGPRIKAYWDRIPEDTRVLITHGPPFKKLDYVEGGARQSMWNKYDNVGCEDLLNRVNELKQLEIHCFGHIHAGYGMEYGENGTIFINASQLNESYMVANKPIVLDINL